MKNKKIISAVLSTVMALSVPFSAFAADYTGTAHIDQFGEYDVTAVVSVADDVISGVAVEGSNFSGTYAEYNQTKLQTAADGMTSSFVGLSATDAEAIASVDAVSGATYSSNAIKSAVLDALSLEDPGETITVPESIEEGTYTVDITFITDVVDHSIVDVDDEGKAQAILTVDAEGNVVLTTDIVCYTDKEPLFITEFNGYYTNNDTSQALAEADVTKSTVDYTDDNMPEGSEAVTKVSFPLEGDYAESYTVNATIYVPAMSALNGVISGITFVNGSFSVDCIATVYWDSMETYTDSTEENGIYEFGTAKTYLEPNTYTLPVTLMKSSDITAESMANGCISGAEMTVNEDGSAVVSLSLQSLTVYGATAWGADWSIYQDGLESELVVADITSTDEDGNVTGIQFTLPDSSTDGTYISVSTGRASDAYLAMDFANAVPTPNGIYEFGTAKTYLEPNTYTLPVTLMKSSDITAESMANGCISGAEMTVNEDGSAVVSLSLQSLTVYGATAWGADWSIYQDGLESELVVADITSTDEDGNVTGIQFTLPDSSTDGTYISVSTGRASDAYLAMDFANASVAANAYTFGSAATVLEPGTYVLPVSMKNASNISADSMAASCITGAILTVNEDGSAVVTLSLQSVTVATLTDWATDWQVYSDGVDSEKTAADVVSTDEDGNVTSIQFTLPDNSADGVYISMYIAAMAYSPNAYLAMDFANAYVTAESVLYGDANQDGTVDASDAAIILQMVLNASYTTGVDLDIIDVDGSGSLEASDAAYVLQKVLNSDYDFPVEG